MPTIRGSGIQQAVASSYTVAWPAGTAAGDLAIIFGQQASTFTIPTGWTQLSTGLFNTAGTARGVIIYKTLTAADITAGSIAVATAGSNSGTLTIITFVGSFHLSCQDYQATGATTFTPISATPYGTTAEVLYFGTNIANSANTVNLGASQQTNSAASSSAALYAGALTGSGTVLPTFSFATAGTGYYAAVVMVFAGGDGSYAGGNDLPVAAAGTNEAEQAGWPVVVAPAPTSSGAGGTLTIDVI